MIGLGIGMAVAGGLMAGNAAAEQADAQYQQAMQQHLWANFKGQTQTDQANRAKAQASAARRWQNKQIAENANYIRAISELDLDEKTNIAFGNASRAYLANRQGVIANRLSKGVGRGGTQRAMMQMLRSRNANDIITISEQKRRAAKQIEQQHGAALAQRNYTFDEASVFIGGAPPVHQGGPAQTMAAAFQGAQAGLSMASSLSNLGGGLPTGTNTDMIGSANLSGSMDAGLSGGTSVTGSVGGYGQQGSFA